MRLRLQRALRRRLLQARRVLREPQQQALLQEGRRGCGQVLHAERGVQDDPRRHRIREVLRATLRAGAGVVRPRQVLPAQVALRQRAHGALQAVPAERGGVQDEVLRPPHVALLRRGRLLPEEPIVLRQRFGAGRIAGLLPAADEMRDPDPAREHRHRAEDAGDLLPHRTLQHAAEALLPAREGGTQHSGPPHTAPGRTSVLLPPGQVCGSGTGRFCANINSDQANCGRCGNVCQSGDLQRGDLRPPMSLVTLLASLALAAVFAVAAATKLADRSGTREAVVAFGAPSGRLALSRCFCHSPS